MDAVEVKSTEAQAWWLPLLALIPEYPTAIAGQSPGAWFRRTADAPVHQHEYEYAFKLNSLDDISMICQALELVHLLSIIDMAAFREVMQWHCAIALPEYFVVRPLVRLDIYSNRISNMRAFLGREASNNAYSEEFLITRQLVMDRANLSQHHLQALPGLEICVDAGSTPTPKLIRDLLQTLSQHHGASKWWIGSVTTRLNCIVEHGAPERSDSVLAGISNFPAVRFRKLAFSLHPSSSRHGSWAQFQQMWPCAFARCKVIEVKWCAGCRPRDLDAFFGALKAAKTVEGLHIEAPLHPFQQFQPMVMRLARFLCSANAVNLKALRLDNFNLTIDDVLAIERSIREYDDRALKQLTDLRLTWQLQRGHGNALVMKLLRVFQFVSLRFLQLDGCDMDHRVLERVLQGCPCLQWLMLPRISGQDLLLVDNSVQASLRYLDIKYVSLEHNMFLDRLIETPPRYLSNLEELALSGHHWSILDFPRLGSIVSKSPSIYRIHLRHDKSWFEQDFVDAVRNNGLPVLYRGLSLRCKVAWLSALELREYRYVLTESIQQVIMELAGSTTKRFISIDKRNQMPLQ